MNINIPVDSRNWLFQARGDDFACLWSLGCWRPKCLIGEELIFRFDGVAVARAMVREILRPGEHNCVAHHGLRELKGWKVVWYQNEFEDLRTPPFHWRCQMCSRVHATKSAAIPNRSCPGCGCRFEDRTYWIPVLTPDPSPLTPA